MGKALFVSVGVHHKLLALKNKAFSVSGVMIINDEVIWKPNITPV